jgi:hypothetical protein
VLQRLPRFRAAAERAADEQRLARILLEAGERPKPSAGVFFGDL